MSMQIEGMRPLERQMGQRGLTKAGASTETTTVSGLKQGGVEAAKIESRPANAIQQSKIGLFFENLVKTVLDAFQRRPTEEVGKQGFKAPLLNSEMQRPAAVVDSGAVASGMNTTAQNNVTDGVKAAPKHAPHVDMATYGKAMLGLGVNSGATVVVANGVKMFSDAAKASANSIGDTAAATAATAVSGAASLASTTGAAAVGALSIVKVGMQIDKDVKAGAVVNADLKKLKTEQEAVKSQLEAATGVEERAKLTTELNKVNTKISSIQKQSVERVLTSVSDYGGAGLDMARTGLTLAGATGGVAVTAMGTVLGTGVPVLNLVQQVIMAPLNIAQLSRVGTALTRVDNKNDKDLAILNNVKNTKEAEAASEAKKLAETQTAQADALKASDDVKKAAATQKSKPSIFETIRGSIQKVLRKEVSDKTKAIVGTAIGITIGAVSLALAAIPVVGWALLGISLAITAGYAIYKAVRDGRNKEKVETNKTSLDTVVKLANKNPDYKTLEVKDMLKMSKSDIAKVFEAAKDGDGASVDIKNRVQGGLFPKYEKTNLGSINSDTVTGWITDIKKRDATMIDYQIKDFYDGIKERKLPEGTASTDEALTQLEAQKETEITALCRWISKATSIDKGNEAEVRLWLENGFKDLKSYKSPFDNLLSIQRHPPKK